MRRTTTILATLIATLTVAQAAVPVSQARPSDNRYAKSAEAEKKRLDNCVVAQVGLEEAEKDADKAASKGDKKNAGRYAKLADGFWAMGVKNHCWAD
jgi:uncharacterized protein YggE